MYATDPETCAYKSACSPIDNIGEERRAVVETKVEKVASIEIFIIDVNGMLNMEFSEIRVKLVLKAWNTKGSSTDFG